MLTLGGQKSQIVYHVRFGFFHLLKLKQGFLMTFRHVSKKRRFTAQGTKVRF